MDSRSQEILTHFEENIHLLIRTNEALQNDKRLLKGQLEAQQNELKAAREEIEKLKDQYQRLLIAKGVSLSDEERKEAHRHLAALVRDVNACIKLMDNNE